MKCLWILTVLFTLVLYTGCSEAIEMKKKADNANEITDSLLKAFKKKDEELKKSNQAINSANKYLKETLEKKLK